MNDSNPSSPNARQRRPAWNRGKFTRPKPPLRPGYVWSIRAKLQLERRIGDLAICNLAIDSKLRGCDLVALRVDDVAPNGYPVDRATIRQGNGSARPLRADRGHTPGTGRRPARVRPEGRAMLVPGPACPTSIADDAPMCEACLHMDLRLKYATHRSSSGARAT
jgi:hypothetical protein